MRENVGKYREEYIKMLGFPLTEERKTPKLSEKIFVAQDGDANIYRLTFLFFGKVKFYAMYFEQVENPDRKPLVIGLHGGEGTETIFLTQNFMCEKTSARLSGVVIGNYLN